VAAVPGSTRWLLRSDARRPDPRNNGTLIRTPAMASFIRDLYHGGVRFGGHPGNGATPLTVDRCTPGCVRGGVNGVGALAGERRGGGTGGLEVRPHLMSSSILSDFLDSGSLIFFKSIHVWMVKESFFYFWLLLWTSGMDGE
jgi:hypothetical protein